MIVKTCGVASSVPRITVIPAQAGIQCTGRIVAWLRNVLVRYANARAGEEGFAAVCG